MRYDCEINEKEYNKLDLKKSELGKSKGGRKSRTQKKSYKMWKRELQIEVTFCRIL